MHTRPISCVCARALLATLLALFAARCSEGGTPSNASSAFTQIPLTTPSGGTGYATPAGHLTWPTFLDDPHLIQAIGGSDTILIASTRDSGVTIGLNGSVTYTFPPNTFANRVGAIVTANDWTDGSDTGFPVLTASFTFSDGRTWGTGSLYDVSSGLGYPFLLRYRVRNWSDQVVPGDPFFVAQPLNPAVFQLCAQASNGGVGNVYSDLQTFYLPDTLRNAALQTVTFASHTTAFDSTHITSATGLVTGCAVWPDFQIVNRHDLSLSLQMQTDPTYNTRAYGGYVLRDTLFGTSKTINANGCMLSCMAMTNTFFGDSTTVPALNDYLVRHRGYGRVDAAVIDSVLGQDVGNTVEWHAVGNRNIRAGDSLLIEVAPRNPLVTLAATSPSAGTIVRRHRSGVIAKGVRAAVYGLIDPTVASTGFGTNMGYPWALTPLGDGPGTPALVETALVDSLPVLLNEPGHYVLAHGWRPSFDATSAAGTYLIRDPGHTGVVRLNQIFSTGSGPKSYGNMYSLARRCTPTDGSRFATQSSVGTAARAGQATADVAFVLQGGGRLSIVDPNGQFVYFNDSEGYVGTIPDADGWADFGGGLDDDPSYADPGVEVVRIPGAVEGDYRIVVSNAANSSIVLGASALDGSGFGGEDAALYAVQNSGGAGFLAHVVGGGAPSVQIDTLGTTDVQPDLRRSGTNIRVSPNPSRGQVLLGMELRTGGRVVVEVFDLSGRLVATPVAATFGAGRHDVSWNASPLRSSQAGILFVRMKAPDATMTRRIVFLP